MDFADAEENIKPTQTLDLTQEDLKEDGRTDLNYVKFQYVDHITVTATRFVGIRTLMCSAFGADLCRRQQRSGDYNTL